jgi:FAD/FMN-containing dehydrogenase
MGLTKEVYQVLESIVGHEYISDDPDICRCYTRGGYGKDLLWDRAVMPPACVILPGSTEEVRKIVKLANRHKIPYVPAGAFWFVSCGPMREGMIFLDLKRMKSIEIDEKNMYAIVDPYVIYSQLQAEAMKRGLYITIPGGGAQVTVVANQLNAGWSPLNYRCGGPHRRILGVEWILPDGEMLRLGSLAMDRNDYFWGEGIGPDLRGIVRGLEGWYGGLGIVTKLAVKLFPFQPERLEPSGISPDTTLQLPTSRVRRYNITYNSLEQLFDTMRELASAEIGASMSKVPVMWRYRAKAKSREHFWELWDAAKEEIVTTNPNILLVVLVGYTSEKQLEYEERVLNDILAETGGTMRRALQTDESWFKNADSVGMWWAAGGYVSVKMNQETLDHAMKSGQDAAKLKMKYVPPLVDDYGDPGWFQVIDFGHTCYNEFLTEFDISDVESLKKAEDWTVQAIKQDVDGGYYNGWQNTMGPLTLTGPGYPNNLSNPPRPDDFDEVLEKHCPWVERNW